MKSRRNNKNKKVTLETLCLECGKNGYTETILSGFEYDLYEDECINCNKKTLHIKCKSLDELKSKLQFKPKLTELDNKVLDIMEENKRVIK